MSLFELKEKIIWYLYQRYKVSRSSFKELIVGEEEIVEEVGCPISKVKVLIETLQSDGIVTHVTIGCVPGRTMPAGYAVFWVAHNSDACPHIGYKITVNPKILEKTGAMLSSKFLKNIVQDTVDFDALNGVVRYGAYSYKFHKKSKRLELFRILWERRRYARKGEMVKGEALPPEACAA